MKAAIIRPHARALELPLLVGLPVLSFYPSQGGLRDSFFAVYSLPNPKEGILDVLV